jgi:hypothetical protein
MNHTSLTLFPLKLQIHLTFILEGRYLNFCMAYEKDEYYLDSKRYSYEVNSILWRIKWRLYSMS